MNLSLDTLNLVIRFNQSYSDIRSLMLVCRELYNKIRNDKYTWYLLYTKLKFNIKTNKHQVEKDISCMLIDDEIIFNPVFRSNLIKRRIFDWFHDRSLDSDYKNYLEMNLTIDKDENDKPICVYDDKFKNVLQVYLDNNKCKNSSHFCNRNLVFNNKVDYYNKLKGLTITRLKKLNWTNNDVYLLRKAYVKFENAKNTIKRLEEKKRKSIIGNYYKDDSNRLFKKVKDL